MKTFAKSFCANFDFYDATEFDVGNKIVGYKTTPRPVHIRNILIKTEDVWDVIEATTPKLSGFSAVELKNCKKAHFFNECIRFEYFPNAWKSAKVTPILKGQNPLHLASSFRLSILNSLSKLCKKSLKSVYRGE